MGRSRTIVDELNFLPISRSSIVPFIRRFLIICEQAFMPTLPITNVRPLRRANERLKCSLSVGSLNEQSSCLHLLRSGRMIRIYHTLSVDDSRLQKDTFLYSMDELLSYENPILEPNPLRPSPMRSPKSEFIFSFGPFSALISKPAACIFRRVRRSLSV